MKCDSNDRLMLLDVGRLKNEQNVMFRAIIRGE